MFISYICYAEILAFLATLCYVMRISLRALDVYAEKQRSTGGTAAHNSNPNHISHQFIAK